MKASEMRRYFTGKLKFQESPRNRHDNYMPTVEGNKIGLPYLFTVSRCSGDIPWNNLKGNADNLGLTERELRASVQCQIGRWCAHICLCTAILDGVTKNLMINPTAHREGSVALLKGIGSLLALVSDQNSSGPNPQEKKVLQRVKPKIEAAMETPDLKKVAERILMAIHRFEGE